jgi:sugar/nucleoside kinase (ribokinase family)
MDARAARWDVVGVGANSVDEVHLLPGCPEPHGVHAKMRIRRRLRCCGGQTATALATCAAFGLRARYVGATGADENGRFVREQLAARGVDLEDLVVRDAANQLAVILIDEPSGERIVLWDRDDRLRLADDELPLDVLASSRLIHVDDVDEGAALRAAVFGRERGIPVTSDLDRMTERTETLVATLSIPIFAEHLPAELTGESDPERALRKLRRCHEGILIATLGARGAVALEGDMLHVADGFRVDAIDTTGSGDVFRGAFIYSWLNGTALPQALRFANAAAAVSCTRLGALNGVPALAEVQRQLGTDPGTH